MLPPDSIQPDDARVLESIRHGDVRAFESVVREWQDPLYAYLLGLMRSEAAALDVVQDVFFRLWRNRASLHAPYGLRVYLYTSARSLALNTFRADQRRTHRETTYAAQLSDDVEYVDATEAHDDRMIVAVHAAVDALPSRTREVWRLCREHELSYDEAALILGISRNTIKTQMGRALRLIRSAVLPILAILVVAGR